MSALVVGETETLGFAGFTALEKSTVGRVSTGNAHIAYLNGLAGHEMGIKEIAKHLTLKGPRNRSKPWAIQKIHALLSDSLYMGVYYYGVKDSKADKK